MKAIKHYFPVVTFIMLRKAWVALGKCLRKFIDFAVKIC